MIDKEALPFLKNILDLHNSGVDLTFLENVLSAIKDNRELETDIIDSFSKNQFVEKRKLLKIIDDLNILDSNSEVVIFGSWYGSILIPNLAPKIKRLTCIDLDSQVLKIAKNKLFNNYENVDFKEGDIFSRRMIRYGDTTLFINTSCEHMSPMKDWPFWSKIPNSHFAFISNNMNSIEGHINCVNSVEEFKSQLPNNFKVLFEDKIIEDRGTKYLLVGKISKN